MPRTFAARLLVVGDAAGLVKSTTGGGIYYSLVSATLAAETLISGLTRDQLDEGALSVYQQRWRQRLGPELQAQLALRMLAQRLTDREIDSLFDLARTNGVMPDPPSLTEPAEPRVSFATLPYSVSTGLT